MAEALKWRGAKNDGSPGCTRLLVVDMKVPRRFQAAATRMPCTSAAGRITAGIRISFRAEGDYVHAGFFYQTQDHFQLAGSAVIPF
ncbi:MAG: hypothetical protein DMG40_23980 [Acidobacteria bacterium]|nr:MAG: hypothetical protein DMG40_23980 [Acidobacteriota bacterium]